MNELEVYLIIIFLIIIIIYVIKIIYEYKKGNIGIGSQYLKSAIVILSTLTVGSYIFNIDHKEFIYNHQKEIYQLEFKLLDLKYEDEKSLINKRLNFLRNDIKIIGDMVGRMNFMYYVLIIIIFSILFIIMHYEKKSLKLKPQNKRK